MTIKIRATAQTHPGMVLKNNEDAYLIDDELGFYANVLELFLDLLRLLQGHQSVGVAM